MAQEKNDLFKEVYTIFEYFDDKLINKMPDKVFDKIKDFASSSSANFYIDPQKSLDGQNISEESKDLISLIYYNYIAEEDEKKELIKLWHENESNHQKKLMEQYNPDNLFKEKIQDSKIIASETAIIEYKKSSIFSTFKQFIKKIFRIKA